MARWLSMLVVAMMVSGYYFSFSFSFLPSGVNTKMIMAAFGIFIVIFDGCRTRKMNLSGYLVGATAFAFVFSLMCFLAADYNKTDDNSYSTYFLSFFTWLGGAYTVCAAMRRVHERLSLRILTGYLAFVCTVQCFLALLINRIPEFQQWVDRYILQGQEFLHEVDRLYGIGASLDPSGVRFSVTLILIGFLLREDDTLKQSKQALCGYLVAFFIVSVVGNMISRTTSIGMVMGIICMLYPSGFSRLTIRYTMINFYIVLSLILVLIISVSVYFYQYDIVFYNHIRFAFEGFFNWVETGVWSTGSTDKLNSAMWIWPQDTKSWIIGTGLFDNFVYGTDIGYCRFILYCGLSGFVIFAAFFVFNAWALARRFPSFRFLTYCLLALGFIVWIKVATDIFFIYALFYCLDDEDVLS